MTMIFRSLRRPTTEVGLPVILGGLIMFAAPAVFGQGGLVGPPGVEVTPASRTLDESASVRRFGTNEAEPDVGKLESSPMKAATLGWTTILFDNIEGAFPGPWSVYDANSSSGLDYWDDVSCFSYNGNWSAWCAGTGRTDCTTYDNNMDSWMIYGPFSLADAQDARALFAAWSDVEPGFDGLFIGASVNGTNFYGSTLSQDFGWSAWNFDFTNVPTLGDLRGSPSVWFAFNFESDSSFTYQGVYLDDIRIEKNTTTGGGCTPNSTTLCLPANNRFRVSVYFQTTQGGGQQGNAGAIPLDSLGISKGGIFYFNDAANPEFLVKVLNACASNNRYWVFYAATTNVGFNLTVTDTQTNQTKIYTNPDIHPATTVTDTQAFATCP
jgi:hypothetical protein